MRHLLLCSAIVLAPRLVSAEPQCVLPAPPTAAQRQAASTEDATLPTVSAPPDKPRPAGSAPVPVATGSPAIEHVAAAGAQLSEAGVSHGLRTVVARKDGQFVRLYVAPDGQALVTGLMSDLSVDELVSMTQGRLTELGTVHGLRGIFVPNGGHFQVFYATPDNQRVIPGAMFDAAGKDLTHDQVAPIPGAVPTVEIGDALPGTPKPARGIAASPLKAAESTFFGTAGLASAPRLWMFIDPLCAWSVRAMEKMRPHVASGQVQLAVIPIAVLDPEDQGRSTIMAKSMLSLPVDGMVAAWTSNKLSGVSEAAADQRLAANQAVAAAVGLRGTPMILWRKTDGTEGKSDGLPDDLGVLIASIGR